MTYGFGFGARASRAHPWIYQHNVGDPFNYLMVTRVIFQPQGAWRQSVSRWRGRYREGWHRLRLSIRRCSSPRRRTGAAAATAAAAGRAELTTFGRRFACSRNIARRPLGARRLRRLPLAGRNDPHYRRLIRSRATVMHPRRRSVRRRGDDASTADSQEAMSVPVSYDHAFCDDLLVGCTRAAGASDAAWPGASPTPRLGHRVLLGPPRGCAVPAVRCI